MEKIKQYFKSVNQWNVIFYTLILIQLWIGYVQDELLHSLWGVGLIWALFLLGYNSLDRELEINLNKAKAAIAKKTKKGSANRA